MGDPEQARRALHHVGIKQQGDDGAVPVEQRQHFAAHGVGPPIDSPVLLPQAAGGLGVAVGEGLHRCLQERAHALAESEERKFRAQDLAEAVHLSQSALSRLVDRLARHGLVERCGCDVDRRGIYVVLTEAGQRRHAEAVPTHRDVLARLLPASMLSAPSSAG